MIFADNTWAQINVTRNVENYWFLHKHPTAGVCSDMGCSVVCQILIKDDFCVHNFFVQMYYKLIILIYL